MMDHNGLMSETKVRTYANEDTAGAHANVRKQTNLAPSFAWLQ